MAVELKVPAVGESITEVQIGAWRKSSGDWADRDESLVEIESDKATVELPAPVAGVIVGILKKEGEKAEVGEVIGYIDENAKPTDGKKAKETTAAASVAPVAKPSPRQAEISVELKTAAPTPKAAPRIAPSARRIMAEHGLDPNDLEGTGPGGRVLKEDAMQKARELTNRKPPETAQPEPPARPVLGSRDEEAVPMTPMRRRIAERLVEAQRTGALLTTFNEVDMSEVIALREEHKGAFQERHGVKLGFMSFFVKACVEALKQFPKVNAEIRHGDIVYHHYYDIGIAVAGGKGLVVPVLRNAESMSLADIEKTIADFGARAQENKIGLDELEGGTFTISNGGVFGSLLSTPIVNPPQSGILGLHAIQDRPVARNGQVVIRPMMYVALSYDHRLVDGREAVSFLRRVKESIEKPARLFLEI
ncbi:MAG: 2-oxoglutarate dehydrogenase complex dihydrolipoyllysine-residue succinyltransferase [Candidatus Hydrogenedentes bacterium]|nr:2-oxoglutarate dehydrogenase complex dihydrolipoyllysine-residue succinyltransferase [Candidatus Hydrogenedentota bacterium]